MRITFVRTAGQRDRVYVQRDDGTEASWAFPSYGRTLPHDAVHYVVERAFGLHDGLWGRVARGVDVRQVNRDANRIGGRDKYAGLGPGLEELWHAEALAAARWSEGIAAVRETVEVTEQRYAEVRAALDRLAAQWRAADPKGSVTVDWP